MKATLNKIDKKSSINWDRAQLVISNNGRIVQTTGVHVKEVFSGLQITDENKDASISYSS